MDRLLLAIAAILAATACATGSGPPADATPAIEELRYDGALRVSPDPARVPDTFVGCARGAVLRLENSGADTAVRVDRVETSSDSWLVLGGFPLDIPAGGDRFVDLVFRPAATGDGSGWIDLFASDAPLAPYRLDAIAVAIERPDAPDDPGPLDLVLVLDVSTTMGTMPHLRDAVGSLFDLVEKGRRDLRIGLTTFVNDVQVHGNGDFLDRPTFLAELDDQLDRDTGTPRLDLPRHQLNFDFPENSLGALFRSATAFPFRPEARRVLLLVTDDTFLEPPAVFSDGIPATVSYAQVAETLEQRDLQLVSIHASATGRGLSGNHGGEPSLPSRTGGTWYELADVASGAPEISDLVLDLAAGRSCD